MKPLRPTLQLAKLGLSLALFSSAQLAHASLTAGYQFNGQGNWSLDAVGGNSTPVGILQAFVPTGSTVERAFLYTSMVPSTTLTSVTFDGNLLNVGSFTNLGANTYGLRAYRTDVTSLVSAKVGGGSATRFDFSINAENPNSSVDGSVLAIVYRNASESTRTIAFLDGFSEASGDVFNVNLSNPLTDPTTPGFEALLSLGIGYSYDTSSTQDSTIRVNGRLLTSAAGGEDDGEASNGGLITAGGLDDSPLNPVDPTLRSTNNPRADDELYNLALGNGVDSAPFLTTGINSFTVNTQNPSGDDNIIFAGINITAEAGVNQPPPTPSNGAVPEPSTYGLLGAVALAALIARRRFKK